MNDLLLSFIRWIKDPFGRQGLVDKHNELLQDMLAAQVIAHERTLKIRGSSAIEQAVRGNQRQD